MSVGRILFLIGALLAFGLAVAPIPVLAWLPGGAPRDPARLFFWIGIGCVLAFAWGRGGG
jgi:hypothetical protein